MKGIRPLYFLVVIVSCFSTFIQAQNWSGILDPARAIDWSQAGIPGGIPSNRTQCGSVVPAGASSSAIQAALNGTDGRGSCANKYVLLGAGTFSLSGSLTIPSNVTLRGSGTQSTILQCGSSPCINMGTTTSGALGTTLIGITGGANQGSTSITVSSASGISVGGYLLVTELNNSAAPWYATNNGGEGTCGWCDQWGGTRARGQIVEVTSVASSVNGATIGITPLYSDYTLSPAVTPFAASAKYAGLESLQIYMTSNSYAGNMVANIQMRQCAYCWISRIEDNYANGDHVQVAACFRDEIRDSYFSNALNHTSGQTESGLFLINKTSGVLVENNIIERAHDSLVVNWGSAGNVFAYNYLFGNFDTSYPTNEGWSINAHGAHPQFNLYEGNVGDMVAVDSIWGSGSHASFFRNWMMGVSKRCSPLSNGRNNISCASPTYSSTQQMGFVITGLHHNYNLVGNIGGSAIGKSLYTETPELIGANYNWSNQTYDFVYGAAPASNTVFPTTLVFGNYSNGNSTLTWERNVPVGHSPAHPSQALPASFFRPAKPAWWGNTIPWPAIGPDVTGGTGPGGHTYSLTASNPAQACYNSSPKGSDGIALFDPTVCYGAPQGGTGNPPPAPSGLNAIVQ